MLKTFVQPLSILNGHPNRKVPGVEANTGPLGHGLPIGLARPSPQSSRKHRGAAALELKAR
jgi:transketolase N-terminal domain/subunit